VVAFLGSLMPNPFSGLSVENPVHGERRRGGGGAQDQVRDILRRAAESVHSYISRAHTDPRNLPPYNCIEDQGLWLLVRPLAPVYLKDPETP
jgi:hypothetical protein